jgi:hypothetical protein
VSEEANGASGGSGPWLDMGAYPNLAPDDAVPEQVLGLLRDVLRTPQVAQLHPDVWHDVLHGAVAPADHAAGAEAGAFSGERHEPDAHESHAHESHAPWQAPEGEHTWHGPGTGPHPDAPGPHGGLGDHGANGSHDDGFHDGGH